MSGSKQSIQYPPQTGPYKVFVKDKGLWRQHTTARLQISVGNPKHDGDKFFALTEWAAARFDRVVLVVSDTLQRHNLALDMGVSLEDAHQIALLNGQKWLRDNKAAIDIISPAKRVLTLWDDWMAHPDYPATYAEIMNIFSINETVRAAVEEKARSFCERHQTSEAFETSVAYILEELAAFAIMFRDKAVDIYPGSWFKEILDAIAQVGGSELLSGLKEITCLRVDFIRNQRPSNTAAAPVHEENLISIKSAF